MNSNPKLLLIDDGEKYANIIEKQMDEFDLVKCAPGKKLQRLENGVSAISFLKEYKGRVDVVLLDMNFDVPEKQLFILEEGMSLRRTKRFQGIAILRKIRKQFPHLPVVLLTAYEDLSLVDMTDELASQSMTYVLDGDDLDTLRVRINAAFRDGAASVVSHGVLWGNNSIVKALHRRLDVLAKGGMPVILEGETGTGKSYIAERFIHANSGRTGAFIVLDLSTVPSNLVSSHLFGAVKGAYTGATENRRGVFELANNGTLFIDEIQNASIEVQKQLLLVLQDRKVRPLGGAKEIFVDVKVIVASNKSLGEAVVRGNFRADLYMRLSPATQVEIPPLRKRLDDLKIFTDFFVKKVSMDSNINGLIEVLSKALGHDDVLPLNLVVGRKNSKKSDALNIIIPVTAWDILNKHEWPGNLRELEMLVHNLITFTLVDVVDAINQNVIVSSKKLNVDPGLVGKLLLGAQSLQNANKEKSQNINMIEVSVKPFKTLNGVAKEVERQYFLFLYNECKKDFEQMAHLLLGDKTKARAVRLRFNQLGLSVRKLL